MLRSNIKAFFAATDGFSIFMNPNFIPSFTWDQSHLWLITCCPPNKELGLMFAGSIAVRSGRGNCARFAGLYCTRTIIRVTFPSKVLSKDILHNMAKTGRCLTNPSLLCQASLLSKVFELETKKKKI